MTGRTADRALHLLATRRRAERDAARQDVAEAAATLQERQALAAGALAELRSDEARRGDAGAVPAHPAVAVALAEGARWRGRLDGAVRRAGARLAQARRGEREAVLELERRRRALDGAEEAARAVERLLLERGAARRRRRAEREEQEDADRPPAGSQAGQRRA